MQLERGDHGHQHHEDAGLHSAEGEGDKSEKKSVLKKVKEKAKKIKYTIKKHGHGHEDAVNHHQVGGSSMCESTVIKSKTLPKARDENVNHEEPRRHRKPEIKNEDPHSPNHTPLLDRSHDLKNVDYDDDHQSSTTATSSSLADKAKTVVASTFTPGDDDKALSEVITDALQKPKEAVMGSSDKEKQPKRGKVTVSKEVAERLGPAEGCKREGEDALAAGEESAGKELSVTDRIQDAFTSWLGKSDGIQTAQDSLCNAYVNNSETSGANVETHR